MSNVRQIAQQSGVSITTVSRVLNNHPRVSPEVRQRVLAATNAAGYAPNVGRKTACNIAYAFEGETTLDSPFDAAILAGIARGLDESGFDLMVLNVSRARLPYETYSQMFQRKGICGALLRSANPSRPVVETITAEGFPAVVIGDRLEGGRASFLDCDSRGPSREAIEHLINLGHRRIAIAMHVVDDYDHTERLAGYLEALSRHGIAADDNLILRAPASRAGGVQVVRRLLNLTDCPTAIYLTDPFAAVGAMNECRRIGARVPEDLSIIGFDDGDIRFGIHPEMTCVCQDAAALGAEAFSMLCGLIQNAALSGNPTGLPLPSHPVVRKSLRAWLEIHGTTGPVPTVPALAAAGSKRLSVGLASSVVRPSTPSNPSELST